jgi:hypothetical protein
MDYKKRGQGWEKWWVFSILLFFGLIVIDVLMGYGDVSALDSPSRLILAIPVFIYIRKVGLMSNMNSENRLLAEP